MTEQDSRRSDAPDEPLRDATVKWLQGLPPDVQPIKLSEMFPRITNRLCELWRRPTQCEAYLADLLFDRRGNRKGFPLAVVSELTALSSYYATVYPRKGSIWDDAV